ncbi:Immunogenic protein MPT70 precursor [Symmachiella dynata]|uniref:Immunogenic protein MPT70 n=1 Tax=Symmachiella dynata TaxID=2527995 RepID=A0A517ZYB9_9PLAN|nr:fasciclin domain-containing protein [Symmachiella dynata]QDU47473.1 Immunogenic protein MPT70 precursor [Symmachiella dynata]
MLKRTTMLASALFAVTVICSPAVGQEKDIVDTAVGAGSFKTLAAALQAADLVEALKSEGPFTVFAPTDEAFSKLPKGTVETLLKPENKDQLVSILTYHVTKGIVPAAKVVELKGAKTLNGQQVDIAVADGNVKVDDANVVKTDIRCSNGIIHVIDQVILPATDDIPTTAVKAGNFSTLVAAAKAAGLVEALSSAGPLTVFAPTDEAFAKLPAGTVESLLKPENKAKLAAILKYHVVKGRVYSADALAAGKANTLQGDALSIAMHGQAAMVNEAKLIATDIDASNGVIHVIDSVLLPPAKQSAVHPRKMIERAIGQGAPLYNSGHASECAQVYMKTAKQILAMENHGMCASSAHRLETAVSMAERTNCSQTQAWTMRRALDDVYSQVR